MPTSGKPGKAGGFVRACGATEERTPRQQLACRCRGVFCGRGGVRKTAEWYRDTKTKGPVVSRSEAEYFLGQLDLFRSDTVRRKWIERFNGVPQDDTVS